MKPGAEFAEPKPVTGQLFSDPIPFLNISTGELGEALSYDSSTDTVSISMDTGVITQDALDFLESVILVTEEGESELLAALDTTYFGSLGYRVAMRARRLGCVG